MVFLAAYSESARLFPPEETTAISGARNAVTLRICLAPIRLLRDRLMDKPLVMAWVPQYSGTILSCHRTPDELDLCVLMRSEYLKEFVVYGVAIVFATGLWMERFHKATQVVVPSDASLLSHTLADPLNEWRLLAQADDREQGQTRRGSFEHYPAVDSECSGIGVLLSEATPVGVRDSERRSLLLLSCLMSCVLQ